MPPGSLLVRPLSCSRLKSRLLPCMRWRRRAGRRRASRYKRRCSRCGSWPAPPEGTPRAPPSTGTAPPPPARSWPPSPSARAGRGQGGGSEDETTTTPPGRDDLMDDTHAISPALLIYTPTLPPRRIYRRVCMQPQTKTCRHGFCLAILQN